MGFWLGITTVAVLAFVSSFGYVMVRDTMTVEDIVDEFARVSQTGTAASATRWQTVNATLAVLSVTGPTGGTGSNGTIGPNGTQGATGSQGPIGPTGPTGSTGQNASLLVTGPTGSVGLTGNAGILGPIGPTGETGPSGPIGPNGTATVTGLAGYRGSDTLAPADLTQPPSAVAGSVEDMFSVGTAVDPWGVDTEWFTPVANKLYYIPITIHHNQNMTGLSFVYRQKPRTVNRTTNCNTFGGTATVFGLLADDANAITREVTFPNGTLANITMPPPLMPNRQVLLRSHARLGGGFETWVTVDNITTDHYDNGAFIRVLRTSNPVLATLTPGRYFVLLGMQEHCHRETQYRAAKYSLGGLGYDILSTPGSVKPVLGYLSDPVEYGLTTSERDVGGASPSVLNERLLTVTTNTNLSSFFTNSVNDGMYVNSGSNLAQFHFAPTGNFFNLYDLCFTALSGVYSYEDETDYYLSQPCFVHQESSINTLCEMCRPNALPLANFTAVYDHIPLIIVH
jgi:hypothetical protein